ncbi:GNAT family N-acetyltransferase [Kribbella deserti]|uniref:GNAT family N-acetyltransferase n=1 Tax=Kribbella deserti TaxID=1926257 RepID=A0ABV6QKN8_9ACTN
MPPAIVVRDAQADDAEALNGLWREMTTGTGQQSRVLPPPTETSIRSAIERHQADPNARLVVALLDDEVAAMAFLRRIAFSPVHDDATITVEYLHVLSSARRHGLGKALIAEAAAWAEYENSPHVAVLAPSAAREANRFLARLGLGQAAVLRFASTHTIRRRLAAEHAPNLLALLSSRRSVLARRAALLHRAGAPAVPETPPPSSAAAASAGQPAATAASAGQSASGEGVSLGETLPLSEASSLAEAVTLVHPEISLPASESAGA